MSAGPDFAHTDAAEDARVVKARTLAGWCWDAGVAPGEIAGWDEVVRRRVARLVGVNPPSSWDTWARVVQFLELKGVWAAAHEGDERAERVGERPEWLLVAVAGDGECERGVNEGPAETGGTTETPPAQNISSADADTETAGPRGAAHRPDADVVALAEAVSRHPAGSGFARGGTVEPSEPPRGWSELVETGQLLGPGRVCGVGNCGKPAIAATLTLYRCGIHPPQRGEWGNRLDWTPKVLTCAPNRCYCGSHDTHRLVPLSTLLDVLPGGGQDDGGTARHGAAKARQAARAGRGR